MAEQGQISIHTENILPIIKKWLYGEKEIFIRELVSNSSDAIHKLEKLALIGEVKSALPASRIDIEVDKEKRTIRVSDNGLGMNADEIKRYITQVAFSGLKDFVDKYQGKGDEEQIIGHFGLGFYSSFMISDKVEIDTLSYREGEKPAHWTCSGDTNYSLSEGTRTEVGTTITLHVSESEAELLEVQKLADIVEKYCLFMKYPIYLQGTQRNEPSPLWTKSPSTLTNDDYQAFFKKLFPTTIEPLFWIHLNVDYPFKLRGILYFPKLSHELDASQGSVKLYCNQVYVDENCKELIPEFLTLLKGVIDCPDLPLNVSRSALQKDATVSKIAKHITKKIADKLTGMSKTDHDNYVKYWDDIHPFVKYGMMRDEEFFERLKDSVLFKTAKETHLTPAAYLETYGKQTEEKIIYATNHVSQIGYINLFTGNGIDVVLAESMIDRHFLPYFEARTSRKFQFVRVDAEVSKHLIDEAASVSRIVDPTDQKTNTEKIADLFKKHLGEEQVAVRIENLKSESVPALLLVKEDERRFQDMVQMGYMGSKITDFPAGKPTLVVNAKSAAVKNLVSLTRTFNRDEEVKLIVKQIYDLASMQQGKFDAQMMKNFIERSAEILARLGHGHEQTAASNSDTEQTNERSAATGNSPAGAETSSAL